MAGLCRAAGDWNGGTGLLAALRLSVLPGATWTQLGLAAAIGFSSYSLLAFSLCLRPVHRDFLLRRARETTGEFFGRPEKS